MATSVPVLLKFTPSRVRDNRQDTGTMRRTISNSSRPIHPRGNNASRSQLVSDGNLYQNSSPAEDIAAFAAAKKLRADAEATMADRLFVQDPNSRPKCFRNVFEEIIFVFTVMIATASTTFLQGAIVINTAIIGKDLRMTEAQVAWITAAIGLASGSFMLFFGKTADLFGSKIQLCGGMMNIYCGFLGLGTAVVSPPAIGALFATYPEGKRRNAATGALGAGNPIGFILGSISSGLVTKKFGWNLSFLIVCIFFAFMALFSLWTVPSIPRPRNMKEEWKRFDWVGTFATVTGISFICAALTDGPVNGWKSAKFIAMFIIGIMFLASFVIWERNCQFPLLAMDVWKNKNYTLCVLVVFFGYMSFITNQFWISLYMQDVQNIEPIMIAVRLLPQAIAGIFWSYLGGVLAQRINGTILMAVGGLAYLAGALLQIFIQRHTSYWMFLFPSLCITVLGADIQFIVSNLYISTQMPSQTALGAGVLQTVMRLSVSVGLAITYAAYGSTRKSPQAHKDITSAFDSAYFCSIAFAAAGLVFVPFMRIGKQGAKPKKDDENAAEAAAEKPHSPQADDENYQDEDAQALGDHNHNPSPLNRIGSISSFLTQGTYGSEGSYFPRWSWEDDAEYRDGRHRDGRVIYEVCIKCSEERRVRIENHLEPICHYELEAPSSRGRDSVMDRPNTQDRDERVAYVREVLQNHHKSRRDQLGAGISWHTY